MTGRTISVLAQIEVACTKCGGSTFRLGTARVLSDGRIAKDGVTEDGGNKLCPACQKKENRQVIDYNKKVAARRRWQEKAKQHKIELKGKT